MVDSRMDFIEYKDSRVLSDGGIVYEVTAHYFSEITSPTVWIDLSIYNKNKE